MRHHRKSLRKRIVNRLSIGLAAATSLAACNAQTELAPVDATKPSEDARILNATAMMSDGTPVLSHIIDTIDTGIEMASPGGIGGVAVDPDGNVFNTNFDSSVWRTAPDGTTVLLNDEFTAASGNYALDNGDLLQADWREHKIYRISPDGTREVFAEGGLDGPVGIAREPGGSFLVANYTGKYIARVPADGGAAEKVLEDPNLEGPNGVTLDADGNAYIADLEHGKVLKWTPEGALVVLTELPGKGNSHNVFANGALYVNKIWDHVIYRVELDNGAYGVVAGNGRPGYQDGVTGVATIEEPNGIAANRAGDTVYFNTHRGLMFEKPGLVVLRRLRLAE